jgi:hypothetical protein
MTLTDEILMRQVRDGDVEKLGILFSRHHRALFNFLSRTMGNRTAAQDLAQDVFCGILKFSGTFRRQPLQAVDVSARPGCVRQALRGAAAGIGACQAKTTTRFRRFPVRFRERHWSASS